jgi:hypothetical protein
VERKRYKVICPNKECPHWQLGRPYAYWLELETSEKPSHERCPLCGFWGTTEQFQITEEVKK